MALAKQRKTEIVAEVTQLLESSKLTVLAKYPGTSVKSMQNLRKLSKESGTTVQVIKNRLFKKALESSGKFGSVNPESINGQLIYAFNDQDEVAPAQNLANFAKTETQIEFVGALTAEGTFLSADEVKALAALPSKDQLRAQLVAVISAPLTGFVSVVSGNVRQVLGVLNARAEQIK